MKMFKKLVAVTTVLCMTFAMSICAFAAEITAEEQEIIDALRAGVVVDGETVTIPENYINQAESYLMREDIASEQVAEVLGYVEEAKNYVVSENITDLSSMSSSQMDEMIAVAQEAAEVVDVKLTVNTQTGIIKGVDEAGKVVLSGELSVKQTGTDMNATVAVAVALVAVVGVCVVVASKKKVFEA